VSWTRRSWLTRIATVIVATAGVSLGFVLPAQAMTPKNTLTCEARPGAAAETTRVDGLQACGAVTDGAGTAYGYSDGGVGFADAHGDSTVGAVGLGGGVGAAEGHGALLGAFGTGADALALGVLDEPGVALVAAGPHSQAFVGDGADPILCQGDMALAVNVTNGRGCLSFGEFRFATPEPVETDGPVL